MAIGYNRYGYPDYTSYSAVSSFSLDFAPPKPTPPAPPKFKENDRVNVKIDASAVVDLVNEDGTVDLKFSDGKVLEYVPVKHVTLSDPVNWPPKIGQVWATPDGKLYGVRKYNYGASVVIYLITEPSTYFSDYSMTSRKLKDFKALRPVLVK